MRNFIDIVETAGAETILYHATPAHNIDTIDAEGIKPVSYWAANESIADYYAEDISDGGHSVVIYSVRLGDLDPSLIEPDQEGIDEPISYTLKMSDEEVWEKWEATDGSWQACLDLIGSIRYRGIVKPTGKDSW